MMNQFIFMLGCMGAPAASGEGNSRSSLIMFIPMILLLVVFYFIMIRPQKKKQAEEQKLRDSVQIGDDITTIGGITGKIVTVREDSIVIVTSSDKTKMEFKRWAIQTNDTANARAAEEKAALEAAKAQEKEEKKEGKRRTRKSEIDETKKEDKE